jgi:hypothetical protein
MRKLMFRLSMLFPAVYVGLVSAQGGYGAYPYDNSFQDQRTAPMAQQQTQFLRWRPLDEASSETPDGMLDSRIGGSHDYADQPNGVPPGTYRRIEQRHTITPQLEGYRFRPIKPEEQLRNRSRNETQYRANRDRRYSQRVVPRGAHENYRRREQPSSLNFRPDPRLDNGSSKAPPRYTFPMGSTAPVFRPQR